MADAKGIVADALQVDLRNDDLNPQKTFQEIAAELTESSEDRALRPKTLSDYIGQEDAKSQLEIALAAAKKRGEALDHVLIFGPPGLGKTTLSNIIANELGVNLSTTSGPALEKKGDAAALLTNLARRDVLFIDEIHRLSPVIEEFMYPAMEDYKVDILTGEGPSARSIQIGLQPFTLIGATTRAGTLTSPLRARFGIILQLQYYSPEELSIIIKASAKKLKINIDEMGALELARRSRGTPRIANRLLKRVRDYAEVKGDGVITQDIAHKALDILKIDVDGFDDFDRAYLRCMIYDFNGGYAEVKGDGVITQDIAHKALDILKIDVDGFDDFDRAYLRCMIYDFNGGPVGIESLAASLGYERETLENVVEPYLIQQGFVQRSSRGRVATYKAYDKFDEPMAHANN